MTLPLTNELMSAEEICHRTFPSGDDCTWTAVGAKIILLPSPPVFPSISADDDKSETNGSDGDFVARNPHLAIWTERQPSSAA
nr:hypothetical protein CFP56_02681 [Quercus suber]